MAVLTRDILLTGIRRDVVFDWLGNFSNHEKFLENAFENVKKVSDTTLELEFKAKFKKRTITYTFLENDSSHGGRRVKIKTEGKRTTGQISYSLRTMKPSSNTLITMHLDYNPGKGLGMALNAISIHEHLGKCFTKALENISKNISNSS